MVDRFDREDAIILEEDARADDDSGDLLGVVIDHQTVDATDALVIDAYDGLFELDPHM